MTLRLVLSVVLMSGWQKLLLPLNAIYTLKLKQLELLTDVTTIKCEVLLRHGDSLASGTVRTCSLSPVVLLQTLLLLVWVLFHIHSFLLSDSLPPSLSNVTVLRFAFSHHVFGEAGRGSPAVQDGRSRGALHVRSCHGHVLLWPLGYDQEHLRGRWEVSPVRQPLPGAWNRREREDGDFSIKRIHSN